MPEFTMDRNYTLCGYGHIINFEKDVPASVPELLVNEAVAIGATPVAPPPPDGEGGVTQSASRV